tara:strand:+ start:1043 stop:1498 length:456 start_codon:yes stop_codon:yes gene_type:complete
MGNKKIERHVGDIVKVRLEDGDFCFGRILEEPLVAFYDLKTVRISSVEEIVKRPILFKIWVMNHAINSGAWEVIGHHELEDDLKEPVRFFKQDPISKGVCLYINSEEVPATREQCEGLDRAAVWNPEHVEDRLRDHYLGVPNQWVESLKLK